jgi:hypothetical protein
MRLGHLAWSATVLAVAITSGYAAGPLRVGDGLVLKAILGAGAGNCNTVDLSLMINQNKGKCTVIPMGGVCSDKLNKCFKVTSENVQDCNTNGGTGGCPSSSCYPGTNDTSTADGCAGN